MPCICYGAISGDEEFDTFLKSQKGKDVMDHLSRASLIIKSHKISIECGLHDVEFRQMFFKAFMHMLVGCDESGMPRVNE